MLRRLLEAIALACLGACASIGFDYPRAESFALKDTSDTYLGAQIDGLADAHPAGQSGFFPLSDGIDALSARLHTLAYDAPDKGIGSRARPKSSWSQRFAAGFMRLLPIRGQL